MAEIRHPYIPSPGVLIKSIDQFRKNLPQKIDSSVLKKLSLASNNEGMVIATLKFLGFIDDESNKTELAKKVFLIHDNILFAKEFEKVVSDKYKSLFDLQGDQAWTLDRNTLISFFRSNDGTSAITATRQAVAFETLSSLSGHSIGTRPASNISKKKGTGNNDQSSKPKTDGINKSEKITKEKILTSNLGGKGGNDIGLTVRIEINLPAQGDQDTYDKIFLSIKKNLLNG